MNASGCWEWSAPLACGFSLNSFPTCMSGTCGIGCNTGFRSCDTMNSTGCETEVQSNIMHCGACNNACNGTGGTPSCTNGSCGIACFTNRGDCNVDAGDGCEASLLTDGRHCGACGRDCLGGACSAGKCQPLVLATGVNPKRIAVDSQFVYWTNEGTQAAGFSDGSVYKVSKLGGTPVALATNQPRPIGITVDATHVFFTTQGPSGTYNGSVKRVPTGGGTVVTLASAQPMPWAVAIDPLGRLWWACRGTYNTSSQPYSYNNDGSVRRSAKDGSGQVVVAANQAEPVAIAFPGWVGSGDAEAVWALRGGYMSSLGGIGYHRTSGTNQTIVSGQPFPESVAADTNYAYYPVQGGGVRRALLYNPASQPPLVIRDTLGGNSAEGMLVDATHVYWTETGSGQLRRAPIAGGTTENLHNIGNNYTVPLGLASDGTAMYWVAEYSGSILKLAK